MHVWRDRESGQNGHRWAGWALSSWVPGSLDLGSAAACSVPSIRRILHVCFLSLTVTRPHGGLVGCTQGVALK